MSAQPNADSGFTAEKREMPSIPDGVLDRYGLMVDLRSDRIRFNDPTSEKARTGVNLNGFSNELKTALKLWIAHSVKLHSPQESCNQSVQICGLLEANGIPLTLSDFTLQWWQRTRQTERSKNLEYKLHRLRAWFVWMAESNFPDIDREVANTILGWSIPGNIKGESVMSSDASEGPLTNLQFAQLLTKVTNLAAKAITPELALVKLCMNLGPNPKQVALLEERDLSCRVDPKTGSKEYFLNIPRIKKRHDERVTRRRHILPETGEMLSALITRNRLRRGDAEGVNTDLKPIFSRNFPRKFPHDSPFFGRFDWHHTTDELGAVFKLRRV